MGIFRYRTLLLLGVGIVDAECSLAQQVKGDRELELNGAFTIPHSDPGSATGVATVGYGYYFRKNDLLGMDTLTMINKDSQMVYAQGRIRHLFSMRDPTVYPFVGVMGGGIMMSGSGGSNSGIGTGEAGVKFFVSQRTAVEISYDLLYVHQSGGSFVDNTTSTINVGFTHIFGGHHR
jgi:hypothetical protein